MAESQDQVEVIGGVDTHADTHTAAVVDERGRMLGHRQFPTPVAGYRALVAWVSEFGPVRAIGVEGTGSYGVGLARYLRVQGVQVVEVFRPTAGCADSGASLTRSMPRPPPARCSLVRRSP